MEGVLNMFQELWAGRRIKGGQLDRIKTRLILRRCVDGRIEAVKVVKREERATKRYRLVFLIRLTILSLFGRRGGASRNTEGANMFIVENIVLQRNIFTFSIFTISQEKNRKKLELAML